MSSCKLNAISVIQFLHIKKKFHSYLYVNYFHENVFPQKTRIFFLNILIFAFPKYASVRTLIWRRKWQPTPVFLSGESQGRRSLVGCRLWGCTELDTAEAPWQQHPSIPAFWRVFIINGC